MLAASTAATRRARVLSSADAQRQARRALHALPAADVRARFLQFFEENGHTVVPSAPLVPPGGDTSLLFTNAGMVPFKQCFLGAEQRPYTRATSAQRCVRAGGKHNDLEQVGLTRRHHTLFEMLGNFSFGDYFKEDAIAFSWRFLTRELGLPEDRLHVTVLANDDEARQLWKKVAQLSDNKIVSHGEDDNFWAMGDSGPCGPCSEIFWDLGDHIEDPDERFLELWNLVFMQFFRNEGDTSGTLHPLPKPSVDTGMGLERIASVLQGVPSNYHTDVFVPLMSQVVDVMDRQRSRKSTASRSFADILEEELDPRAQRFGTNQQIQTIRIVSDHLKASYAMLNDGIFPSNIGRGYVLRRIIRRAIRHAQNCGVEGAFLSSISIPEWENAPGFAQMRSVISNEERAFEEMLSNGKRAMEKVFSSARGKVVSGTDAFRLYDTYGIPLDISQILAEERGLSVDAAGFEACLDEHKRKASESSAFVGHHGGGVAAAGTSASLSGAGISGASSGEFVGYDSLSVQGAHVLSVWSGSSKQQSPETFWVSIDRSPFYAEGGGQVGDKGHLVVTPPAEDGGAVHIQVNDTKRLANDIVGLHCAVPAGMTFSDVEMLLTASGATVDAHVDKKFRRGCQVHHTATHLLQRALKQVLGDHVTQCGSFVTADRLRFDFAHFGALSLDEMAQVEQLVNEMAAAETPVETLVLPREQAEQSGAICNFGEKYGDVVRVVRIGDASSEFCGGTHAANSAAIFPFVLLSEGSVAAGTRRMEAVAGVEGARHLQTKDKALQSLAAQLETTPAKVAERVSKLQRQVKQLESHAQALGDLLAALPAAPVARGRMEGAEGDVHFHELSASGSSGGGGGDLAKVLRRRAEFLLREAPASAHVVVAGAQVAVASGGAHAGNLLQQVVRPLGGRGGGSAGFAQGSLPGAALQIALSYICPMSDLQHSEVAEILGQLRAAVRELRLRGLKQAAKFASELVLGVPDELRAQLRGGGGGGAFDRFALGSSAAEDDDGDRYDAAMGSFDVGEFLRAHQLLEAARCAPGSRAHFLRHYALFMAGEKAKEEMDLEISVTGAKAERSPHRDDTNPHLKELYLSLSAAYQQNELDAFGLYLYAVVLKRLGYRTSAGRSDVHSAASTPTRHPADVFEEEKREQQKRRSVDGFANIAATANTNDVTTRFILIESIRQYPWNWSAWMELAALSPFTSNEEEVVLSESCSWMFHLFQAHALLDQQQNDAARQLLDHLAVLFPHSTYLVAQQALTSYHMRDFDQAQEQFERLALADPHRVETMDVYSNVLYVKEDKTELSRLAHRALKVEKYRPETCCIIGNYYSLKNKHDRAIVYFHRALKLDPNFLSAWTLIGHEYVEMKNTSAAIEAYRHAVDLNIRDYRAWYGLGQAYEILNMYLYSIYYYRKAASIRPYDARMWCALGGCYEKLSKGDEAIACFKRAVGNQDREGVASYHLGRIFALRGQQHEAAKYYQLHLGLRQAPVASLRRGGGPGVEDGGDDSDAHVLVLPKGGMNISVDTPQALAAILFLANYYKQMGKYSEAALFCNRLLDLQGPEKEEAKALLREMRSLEAARARAAGVAP